MKITSRNISKIIIIAICVIISTVSIIIYESVCGEDKRTMINFGEVYLCCQTASSYAEHLDYLQGTCSASLQNKLCTQPDFLGTFGTASVDVISSDFDTYSGIGYCVFKRVASDNSQTCWALKVRFENHKISMINLIKLYN